MTTTAATTQMPVIPLARLVNAVSDMTRWRILDELLKGEALPVSELSKRLHVPATNIAKHSAKLMQLGMLRRGYGDLYSIPACYLVPGQRALDFGAVLLRLDRLDAK
ncbi:MAG: helix-turn-helix transcriptional regulator [Verrucomicrobia bacterium]|nr:helix-turn-helix transcriptional regulator [Verrucomicrobiota bacterium]